MASIFSLFKSQPSTKTRLVGLVKMLRPTQWIKNSVIFIAILFNGELFNPVLFNYSLITFVIFCAISSASYIFNDLVDAPFDRKHKIKKNRPIASGLVSIPDATFVLFLLIIFALSASLFLRISLAMLVLTFFLLHIVYTLYLKKHVLFDIFAISASFIIRLLAGEVVTGFHVPIWLWLTIFFFSLFIASVKRHSEYINQSAATRPVLDDYTPSLLQFLVNSFAVMTIFSYSFYAFLEEPPHIETRLTEIIDPFLRGAETRKWFTLTIPLAVFAVARYAQLLYQYKEGEAPEKVITKDKILIGTILLWGFILISLIYIL
jgi:4-hydroxybenzoate polyprenyltransferase